MSWKKDQVKANLSAVRVSGSDVDIVSENALRNIVCFGDDVHIDLVISNPTLQAKKKVEADILASLKKEHPNTTLKIKFIVEKPPVEKVPPLRGDKIPGIDNIIAIASGKGGVGKSTLSSNLACSLAKQGYKVGLIDADIFGPSIPIMFDVEREKPHAIDIDGKTKIEPIESYGVKLLSIGFFSDANKAIVWRGPMATKALNQMIHEAHWGELDYLLIDLPPGTSDIHLSLVQSLPVDGAVVVSTPQKIALADAKKGVSMFQMPNINVPILGLVENMAYFTPEELPENRYYIFGMNGVKHLSEDIGVPFLGEIPIMQSIREASDAGRPAVLQNGTEISKAYLKFSEKVVEQTKKRKSELEPTKIVEITNMDGCST
ncbi:MAG: Mrp/NBP35 family ATP-binding protein [Flavobacteriales bacterium]|jgi:ATP-binding protein involved in chromosome partitioning|nr:Mrp/NBP35 family ATP-binding protein [Flavobacteriales bacterium]